MKMFLLSISVTAAIVMGLVSFNHPKGHVLYDLYGCTVVVENGDDAALRVENVGKGANLLYNNKTIAQLRSLTLQTSSTNEARVIKLSQKNEVFWLKVQDTIVRIKLCL